MVNGFEKVDVPEGQSGIWRVEKFTITEGGAKRFNMQSMFSFSGRGRRVEPGTYTRLLRGKSTVIMSDTSAEMRDHSYALHNVRGHVLIHGLGLGVVLAAVLRKGDVTAVTVIEKSEDVIALVAPSYTDSRVEIVHADAMTWKAPKGVRYGAVWHDIWDSICADNLNDMKTLHRRYGRRADWQGSWCRDECVWAEERYG